MGENGPSSTLHAATVLSCNCCVDFGHPLTKKAILHSRDRPGVTAPLRTNIVPVTAVWNALPSVTLALRSPRYSLRLHGSVRATLELLQRRAFAGKLRQTPKNGVAKLNLRIEHGIVKLVEEAGSNFQTGLGKKIKRHRPNRWTKCRGHAC